MNYICVISRKLREFFSDKKICKEFKEKINKEKEPFEIIDSKGEKHIIKEI